MKCVAMGVSIGMDPGAGRWISRVDWISNGLVPLVDADGPSFKNLETRL